MVMVVVVRDKERGVGVIVGGWCVVGRQRLYQYNPSGRRKPHYLHRKPSIQMQAPPRDLLVGYAFFSV